MGKVTDTRGATSDSENASRSTLDTPSKGRMPVRLRLHGAWCDPVNGLDRALRRAVVLPLFRPVTCLCVWAIALPLALLVFLVSGANVLHDISRCRAAEARRDDACYTCRSLIYDWWKR